MTWTFDYEIGQEIKAYFNGQWCRGAVCSKRTRSLMVFLGKHGHTNIHDPRNITPWATGQEEQLLDVDRGSVVRLLKMANKYHDACVERTYAQTWWAGYIRACEQLLDMEHE